MIKILEKKYYVNTFSFIVTLCATTYSYSKANDFTYFGGVDYLYSKTQFKEDFGGNIIFTKPISGLNVFVGRMFNEHFGAEIGLEFYRKMEKTVNRISSGVVVAGEAVPKSDPGDPPYWESFKTTFSQRHPYIGIVIKTNLTENNILSLFSGASLSRIKTQYTIFNNADFDLDPSIRVRTFYKTKVIPMLRATIEHKFNNKLGIRALVGWKQTSLFKMKAQEHNNSEASIKPKDSFNFGIGATYYIG